MRKVLLLAIAALLLSINVTNAKEIQVKGYTKKDGTKVAGYTRTVKDKDEVAPETKKVAGYTKKDGTKVAGYTRAVKAKDSKDTAKSPK